MSCPRKRASSKHCYTNIARPRMQQRSVFTGFRLSLRSAGMTADACLAGLLDAGLAAHEVSTSLLQANVLLAHEGGPFGKLALDFVGEDLRAAGGRLNAELRETLLDLRQRQHRVGLGVDDIDTRLGRAGRREQPEPNPGIEAGQARLR